MGTLAKIGMTSAVQHFMSNLVADAVDLENKHLTALSVYQAIQRSALADIFAQDVFDLDCTRHKKKKKKAKDAVPTARKRSKSVVVAVEKEEAVAEEVLASE